MRVTKPIIELTGITKVFRTGRLETPVLFGIDLTIGEGEMVAVMGPSGSGKSTLMHIIGLLARPSSGELKISGQPIHLGLRDRTLARLRGQTIGFVFQSFNLLPRLGALANVLLPTTYQRGNRQAFKKRAVSVLTQVGLKDRLSHKPGELSGGEKQRVAIARALINNPDIILADEPTGNLDSRSGHEVIAVLKELNREGKTVIIITHDHAVANQCQRVIQLLDGRLRGGSGA